MSEFQSIICYQGRGYWIIQRVGGGGDRRDERGGMKNEQ